MKLIMKLIMTLIMTSNLTRLAHRSFTLHKGLHERLHERPHERPHERSHERPHVRIALIAFLHEVAKEPKRSIVGDLLLESAESLNLNLANALAGESDFATDLLEGQWLLAFKSVAESDHACITLINLLKQLKHKSEFLAAGDRLFRLLIAVILEHFVELRAVSTLVRR